MQKIYAYIDGFNLYHNLKSYIKDNNLDNELKWLDVRKLVSCFIDEKIQILEKVNFFSAIPTHCSISKQEKHKNYYKALKSANVHIINGRFSQKKNTHFRCLKCNETNFNTECQYCHNTDTNYFVAHEEKETDVSLAINIISDVLTVTDLKKIILVSADTDFIPVVRYILENTDKKITVLLPLGHNYSNGFNNIRNEYKPNNKRFDIKVIKLNNILNSLLPDEIEYDNQIYKNPYKIN